MVFFYAVEAEFRHQILSDIDTGKQFETMKSFNQFVSKGLVVNRIPVCNSET